MLFNMKSICLLSFSIIYHYAFCQNIEEFTIENGDNKPLIDQNITFSCKGVGDGVQWQHKRHIISTNNTKHIIESQEEEAKSGKWLSKLHVLKLSLKDSGKYRCIIKLEENKVENNISLHVQAAPQIQEVRNYTGPTSSDAVLSCTSEASPSPEALWFKGDELISEDEKYMIEKKTESFLHISRLTIRDVDINDNRSYICQFQNSHGKASATTLLFVQDPPEVVLSLVQSLGPEKLKLEWSVNFKDAPINNTDIMIVNEELGEIAIEVNLGSETSVTLEKENLQIGPDNQVPSSFQVFIRVMNENGIAESEPINVTMLTRKLEYIPEVSLKGSTTDSLSVSWTRPDEEMRSYIDYYNLSLMNMETKETIETVTDADQTSFFFENLIHGTMYQFTIEACMKIIKECSRSSAPVSGNTLHEPPSRISDLLTDCISNRKTGVNEVFLKWEPPKDDKNVDRYKIDLKASAQFIDEDGRSDFYHNLEVQTVSSDTRNYTFHNVAPNTNYTLKVYAGSKTVYSSPLISNCQTPIWLPQRRNWRWWKSKVGQRTVLKLRTPKVSQRNGTICCHRIIVLRLGKNQTLTELPEPQKIPLTSYYRVQNFPIVEGYIAEAFISRGVTSQYLLVGDGEIVGNWSAECSKCLEGETTVFASREKVGDKIEVDNTSSLPYTEFLRKRTPEQVPMAEDGHLSKDDNYTGFIIMSVRDKQGLVLSSYSDYFNIIQPIDDPIHLTSTTPSTLSSLTHVVYILGALIIVLLLMAVILGFLLCHYHRKRKQLIEDGTDESLSGSLGRFFRTMRRSHTLMSQPGIDVAPIPKDKLVSEYLEKIKDSELGFRREFEALPEKFYDRSSRSSELTENSSKNRYPDIKAYDQTRVKLSQVNGIVGSDYINANYVMGYKERKKFICAQGPMESTVNDFWRMIVEQRCSFCIMLTNLEETGKVKCVKYWPEAGEPKTFGNITVRLVKEKLYAEYLVRTLRAEWTVSTSPAGNTTTAAANTGSSNGENGVIVSGTATTKSNSSTCNSISNSNYNSLSSNSGSNSEETKCHEVQQYHYLMWKDFVAPEHPVGLLSFLRRINEAYSPDLGPLLVHCSAGVGRTGTLVALDTLVAELDDENQASIFNIICDLRHQRNFLVQSLKQYVFVHRALMEHAQFGNTEMAIPKLKESYSKHIQHSEGEEQSELEKEFERLGKVIEDRKAFTVANNEVNKSKNRYDFVLPYDTNCVILAPLATQIGSTYINASFVSGFDLGENFIVTQDPIENTISDFWRMIYEQEVNTIVMISELGSGENHCAKYWPDEEETHEHVSVKFMASESYPKYSTRSFVVTNTKNGDSITVTQFQYVGWSGHMGEVPLVTYGIMEVITRVQSHCDANLSNLSNLSSQPPTVVHCSGGGDRSSVYVCLNNCLRQLRRESCVDVFQTARKIRSQRQFQLQEFAQYEFVYKALVEYVDMKRGENL